MRDYDHAQDDRESSGGKHATLHHATESERHRHTLCFDFLPHPGHKVGARLRIGTSVPVFNPYRIELVVHTIHNIPPEPYTPSDPSDSKAFSTLWRARNNRTFKA